MTAFCKKPLAYVCFLCGQQYGSQSLHIHIPQCAVKWCQEHDRTSPPPAPPELPTSADQLPKGSAAINAFNATMLSVWQSGSLEKCPYCNRTFRLEALKHHSKVCTAAHPFKALPANSRASSTDKQAPAGGPTLTEAAAAARYSTDRLVATAARKSGPAGRLPPPGDNSHVGSCGGLCSISGLSGLSGSTGAYGGSGSMPKAYTCYLCGQQYGSKSLLIHHAQCRDKWVQQQQLVPSQHQLPVPDTPDGLTDYMTGVAPLPIAANEIAAFNDIAFGAYNSSSLVQCTNCCRTFRPEALVRHAHFCTADRPMKRK